MAENISESAQTLAPEELIKKIEKLNQLASDYKSSNPRLALKYADEAYEISEKAGCVQGLASSLLSKGLICHRISDYDQGLTSTYKALELFIELKDKHSQARAYNLMGIYYFYLSKFEDALENYQKSLEISKEVGNHILEIQTLNNMALICAETGKTKETLEYHKAALTKAEPHGHKQSISALYGNMGREYYNLGNIKNALFYYNKSMKILTEIEDYAGMSEIHNNMGDIYLDRNMIDKAREHYEKSLNLCISHENKYNQTITLQNLSKVDLKENNKDEAIEYLEKARELAENIKAFNLLSKIYQGLSQIYEGTNQHEKSLMYYKEYHRTEKEIVTKELEKKLEAASIQFKLDQAKSESEIFKLKNIELKKSYENMSIISDIGRKITSSLNLDKILNTLHESIHTLMDAGFFCVGLYNRKEKTIDYKFISSNKGRLPILSKPISDDSNLGVWCLINKKDVFINDLKEDYNKYIKDKSPLETAVKSVIYCPLFVENRIIGVISVQSFEKNSYSAYNLNTVKALASYVAIALNNYNKSEDISKKALQLEKEIGKRKNAQKSLEEANKKLESLLSIDVLTGISNRRCFERFARKIWQNAQLNSSPLSVLIIDIDYFKQYNDKYGHLEGDKCLKRVAKTLQQSIRTHRDFAARFGGEEFVIMLPDTGKEEALNTAERLRKTIEGLKIRHSESIVSEYLTISIGVASTIPKSNSSLGQFLQHADNALYQAKDSGRNNISYMSQSRNLKLNL